MNPTRQWPALQIASAVVVFLPTMIVAIAMRKGYWPGWADSDLMAVWIDILAYFIPGMRSASTILNRVDYVYLAAFWTLCVLYVPLACWLKIKLDTVPSEAAAGKINEAWVAFKIFAWVWINKLALGMDNPSFTEAFFTGSALYCDGLFLGYLFLLFENGFRSLPEEPNLSTKSLLFWKPLFYVLGQERDLLGSCCG